MMSTRRAFLSAGSASAIALSLAACSRSQPKTAETVASGTPIAEPVLNDKQLEEILQRVQTGLAAADVQVLAWLLVAWRVVHSAIQCIDNRVVPHFIAFICGALVLIMLWARLAYGVSADV